MTEKNIIGYQIVDCEGYNHHEFMGDSFNLKQHDVLRGQAVEFINTWIRSHRGYTLLPVYEGQYTTPKFIDKL